MIVHSHSIAMRLISENRKESAGKGLILATSRRKKSGLANGEA
jgi:hypothetical protein